MTCLTQLRPCTKRLILTLQRLSAALRKPGCVRTAALLRALLNSFLQVDFLLSMATALPIQMHMEPQVLGESGGPPLFRRAEAMIGTIPELDFLIS